MNIAAMIDHTLLKAQATSKEIEQLCEEARIHGFASVCVNPYYVPLAASLLQDAVPKVCTVIGFPLGMTTTATKAEETKDAIRNGAEEIDMVINVGALKEGRYEFVQQDIAAVVTAANGTLVKVILETCLLTKEEIVRACELSKAVGAQFVKTSTGFSTGGATEEDVRLMKSTVGDALEVKASGGVRTRDDALRMIEAGATRIGTSNGVAIATGGANVTGGGY